MTELRADCSTPVEAPSTHVPANESSETKDAPAPSGGSNNEEPIIESTKPKDVPSAIEGHEHAEASEGVTAKYTDATADAKDEEVTEKTAGEQEKEGEKGNV